MPKHNIKDDVDLADGNYTFVKDSKPADAESPSLTSEPIVLNESDDIVLDKCVRAPDAEMAAACEIQERTLVEHGKRSALDSEHHNLIHRAAQEAARPLLDIIDRQDKQIEAKDEALQRIEDWRKNQLYKEDLGKIARQARIGTKP